MVRQSSLISPRERHSRIGIVLVYLASATLFALYTSGIYATSGLAEHEQIDYRRILLFEFTGAYSGILLIPFLLRFMRRFPIQSGNWTRRMPLHAMVSILFSLCMTLMMWGSRTVLFDWLGWGPYNYGQLGYRFAMEYLKQLCIYWGIYIIVKAVAYARESRERELQASQLEKELAEARLNALKNQLNPHFLFNTLNMISSYVYEDPGIAEKMITRLSDLLRLTLNYADRQEVALQKELEFLDAYLAIMKARFQEQLILSLEIDRSTRNLLIPHLILQPLVENSIKHCTSEFARPGEIRIAACSTGDLLRVVIEDNGPGIRESGNGTAKNGIGLRNTRLRLQELYGERHRFEMENRDSGGLRIVLELPARAIAEEAGKQP